MKRNFTKILAAFALLVFMVPSLVGWGQTRDEVVAYTLEPATGSNSNYASNCDITISGIKWNLTGNSQMIPWRIGGKSLSGVDRTLYSKTAISDNISKIEVTHGAASSITVNSWTVIVSTNADFSNPVSTLTPTFEANTTTTINRPDGADWSNCYYKFVYNVTVSGSSNKFIEFTRAKFYKETGTTLQDSDLSLSPTALSFDLYNDANAKTITISTSSTGAISVSDNAYVTTQVNGVASITVTPVAVTPEDQTITVSQAADNTYQAGEATFSVSVANSTPTYTVTYKANGGTGDDVVDTYYQGDDVTVRSNPFVYTGYAFTKWNTAADGTGSDYQPAATIEDIQANIVLYAQWEESNEVVDVINPEFTGNPTTYSEWNNKQGTSGAVYAGQSTGGTNYIQLRATSPSGIVSTTSGGTVKKVVVTWNSSTVSGRTLNVYGNNTAYTDASDLYGDNAGTLLGTIVMGTSTELTINDDYEYIGLRSASGAMYFDEIRISWEPDNNPAVATTVTINVPEGFNTDIYQGTTAGTLTATVTAGDETISGATVTWSSSDTDVATIDANGAVTLVAVGTTTITANYAGVENEYKPSTGTYQLNVTSSEPTPGSLELPYTVAQARAAIDAGTGVNDVYATGIVSQIVTAFNPDYGNITYNISADGQTNSEQLQAYRGKSYDGEWFTSEDDIQVGDIVVIHGNLKKFSGTYEFDAGNQLVSLERPTFDVETPTFSLAAGTYAEAQNVTITCATTGATIYYTTDGTTPDNGSNEYTEALTVSATTTFKAIAYVGEESSMVTTITYHINSADSPYTVAQALAFHEYPTAQAIWVHGIVSTAPTQDPTTDGQLTYYISDNGAASNQLEVYKGKGLNGAAFESQSDIQVGDIVTITGIVKDYNGTIEFDNGNYLVSFERPAYNLIVDGYTEGSTGGYKLIASPVTVYISEVQGLAEGTYDLYTYNDAEEMEWINYKQTDGMHPFTTLEPGTGYLYAKQATTAGETFSFNLTGAPYTGTGEIPVAAGWNLIGNPFSNEATLNAPFFRMNEGGTGLSAEIESGSSVNAMEGVFVNATEAGNVTFSTTAPGKGQNIALNLSKATRGASTIDRAIVRFDEGQQLPKFQLFENSTKLYIPQGNKDFAIVRSAAEGEMPVSFKASENGTYTLSIEAENVEMNYLHLIDNMTGADVDLLATPNYTFEARTNDYTSRFRLVFSAEENGASTDSATFAFFNGTSWTVSNTGDATLQVVDITGRIVSSETINGNATVSLNQPAGIYMLRLVNGNDVKVQKVVVR